MLVASSARTFLAWLTSAPLSASRASISARGSSVKMRRKRPTSALRRRRRCCARTTEARLQTDALPRVQLSEAEAGEGVTLIDLFIRLEFAKSKSEVRRLVKGGGARLNGEKVEDAELMVSAASFEGDAKELKLSAGKKKHGMVVME